MSRNFFPAVIAIGMGVWTGYYTFQPALRERQGEKGGSVPQGNQTPPAQNGTPSGTIVNDPKDPGK